MRTMRFAFMRATPALIVALAAMLLMFAPSDTATAHEFNPAAGGSVSDPTPGAHGDLTVTFALDSPDSLPTDDPPTILWVPKQWGIGNDAPTGAIGGTFDALATVGILGITPCNFSITFAPTMYVSSVDTSNPTSALDLEGSPGGVGYPGQFVPDPDHPGLSGDITRYPDFLEEMFPSAEVGEPLVRLWGGQMVILSAVSLNIVTYSPGQLAAYGYPASLGYPNVVLLLNPVAPIEMYTIILTSDLCTPLALISTNSGVSQDNPITAADEGGYVLLTNPAAPKEYTFTNISVGQPDADDDDIENMLDTCAFDPNIEDLDGRTNDPDGDGLDGACDPDPLNPSPIPAPSFMPDEDLDYYPNRADNCPLVPNGIVVEYGEILAVGDFVFVLGHYGDVIGANNQVDTDGDDIGDVCDPDPTTITGYNETATVTSTVALYRHGVKLNNLGGAKQVKHPSAKSYSVAVSNRSDTTEDIQVALRVVPGDCATVNGVVGQNSTVVSVGPGASDAAHFTVDWSACEPGEYSVQADACHAGDPAPAGFFGAGACPGVSDGMVDTNPYDDAPMSKIVTVGSP
jgi:hypothetical protein